jgi:hypothetical protein
VRVVEVGVFSHRIITRVAAAGTAAVPGTSGSYRSVTPSPNVIG